MAGVMTTTTTATEMCKLLNLVPHPGGGFYKESFRDSDISLSADSLPPRCAVFSPSFSELSSSSSCP
jgi:predicted cupin superfamily sugar epimerase